MKANQMLASEIEYRPDTFREAGMQARWGKTTTGMIIFVRNPKAKPAHQRDQWWACDPVMFESMKQRGSAASWPGSIRARYWEKHNVRQGGRDRR